MSAIKDIIESRVYDAQGDFQEGMRRATAQILDLMPLKVPFGKTVRQLTPESISVRDLLDMFVIENYKQQGRSVDALLSGGGSRAMAEAINTSQFPRILGRMTSIMILDAYSLAMEGADRLVTESTGHRDDYAYFGKLTGKDNPERVHEGEVYEEGGYGEYEVRIKLRKFGKIFQLTKEMILADRTGQIIEHCKDYGEQMGYHRQTDILECATTRASTIHEGDATSWLNINGTGYAVYADTHATYPGSGGQANDNNLTSTSLSASGYESALTALRAIKDINGDHIMVQPKFVIVAPAQSYTAKKLFISTVEPGLTSGGQDPNIFKGNYEPIVDNAGTAGTWYMGDFAKQIRYVWGWKPMVESTVSQEQALMRDVVMTVKASYKGGCGHIDHRYVIKAAA